MPNRGIKESICTSETLASLSAEGERLVYRLIVNCDDFGRMDARAEIVRSKCFSLITDKISVAEIEAWLSELVGVDLIFLYNNGGKRYLQFVNWAKHNRVRASESKYPAPDDDESEMIALDSVCQQVSADDGKCGRTRTSTRDTNARRRSPEKTKYAEYVAMTDGEHQKLINQYGSDQTQWMINKLNVWKGANGKTQPKGSDYFKILKWVVKAYNEENLKNRASPDKKEALPVL